MAKDIEFSDTPGQYVFNPEGVSFPAWVDGKPVTCFVTEELLMGRFGAPSNSEEDLLTAFEEHKEVLQEEARSLINAGLLSPAGKVLLTRATVWW
jgi:hypothetical protein